MGVTETTDDLRAWTLTVGNLALKRMAEEHGMPGAHEAKKRETADWLLAHHPEVLHESRRLSTRKDG